MTDKLKDLSDEKLLERINRIEAENLTEAVTGGKHYRVPKDELAELRARLGERERLSEWLEKQIKHERMFQGSPGYDSARARSQGKEAAYDNTLVEIHHIRAQRKEADGERD